MIDEEIASAIRELRLVVFDFDGVFTNNEVIVTQDGIESVVCNRSDGLGLRLLKATQISALILSMEANPVVLARAKKLKLECVHGCENKLEALTMLAKAKAIDMRRIAYVGNDVNDVPCLRAVGLPVAVVDAFPEALQAARWTLRRPGGKGAVREFCEAIARVRLGLGEGDSPWEALGDSVYEKSTPVFATVSDQAGGALR